MPKLILIKHASPQVEEGKPPEEWHLSEKGRAACAVLAERLRGYGVTVVVHSYERKAEETAVEMGKVLDLKPRVFNGLEEHDRSEVPMMRSSEFISLMELLFRRPRERVLGSECAAEALERFEGTIEEVLDEYPNETIAVVTHGTVMALFLARHNPDRKGFELWRQLGLPSFVVVEMPGFEIVEMVERL